MSKCERSWRKLGASLAGALMLAVPAASWAGAAFTTFNPHVDGSTKDVCRNNAVNCNLYGAREYVWLNGGPTANGLRPDGEYFFSVLVPGGQPNPNDGAYANLSDDYDWYTNRTFTVTNGEVSAYTGDHWLDDGKSGAVPNKNLPFIRLYPYAESADSRGVYVLAICSLAEGYPVDPRDCDFDAFQVKRKPQYSFMLSGTKFKDTNADGVKDDPAADPGLAGWTVSVQGTGPDGLAVAATAVTNAGGYWQWMSPAYYFGGGALPQPVHLEVCEVSQAGWTRSYPASACHTLDFVPPAPAGFDAFESLDFGNWQPAP